MGCFVMPGAERKIGIDAIIGLALGDVIATLLPSYIIWQARSLGLPRVALGRMMATSPRMRRSAQSL